MIVERWVRVTTGRREIRIVSKGASIDSDLRFFIFDRWENPASVIWLPRRLSFSMLPFDSESCFRPSSVIRVPKPS